MSDDALASQLGLVTARSSALRDRALERLAAELDLPVDEARAALTRLSEGEWRETESPHPTAAASEPPPTAATPEPRDPSSDRPTSDARPATADVNALRRPQSLLLVGALLAVAVIALVVVLSSGHESSRKRGTIAPATSAAVPSGTLEIVGPAASRRLRLSVRNLRSGEYRAWLFNTIIDARLLGTVRPGRLTEVPLPTSFGRYRFVDISRHPAGAGNSPSGRSVLRAATAGLRADVVRTLVPLPAPKAAANLHSR